MREETLAPALEGDGIKFESKCIHLAFVVVISCTLLIFVLKWMRSNDTLSQIYHSQPCPARRNELFPWVRATLRSFTDTPQRVAEGYAKVHRPDTIISNHPLIPYKVQQTQHPLHLTKHPTRPRSDHPAL